MAETQLSNLAYGMFAVSSIPNGAITKIDVNDAEKVERGFLRF